MKCDPPSIKFAHLFWTFYSRPETNQTSGVTAYRAVKRGDSADLSVPDKIYHASKHGTDIPAYTV
jgi:hypothetical protein